MCDRVHGHAGDACGVKLTDIVQAGKTLFASLDKFQGSLSQAPAFPLSQRLLSVHLCFRCLVCAIQARGVGPAEADVRGVGPCQGCRASSSHQSCLLSAFKSSRLSLLSPAPSAHYCLSTVYKVMWSTCSEDGNSRLDVGCASFRDESALSRRHEQYAFASHALDCFRQAKTACLDRLGACPSYQ